MKKQFFFLLSLLFAIHCCVMSQEHSFYPMFYSANVKYQHLGINCYDTITIEFFSTDSALFEARNRSGITHRERIHYQVAPPFLFLHNSYRTRLNEKQHFDKADIIDSLNFSFTRRNLIYNFSRQHR